MKDYLGCILARALSGILCLLPVRLSLWIGRRFGDIMFFFNKKRRMICYANLKAAFCREKTPAQLIMISRGVYRNLGCVLVELLRFPAMNEDHIRKYIKINGRQHIDEARARGKGTVVLTAHFGNWELAGLVAGFLKLPLSVLAREQKHSKLNQLLNSYRQLTGCKVISKGFSTRQLIKALMANEMIGILTDQDAGKQGFFVDFFGRPTSTHSGGFIFAQRTGATLMPTFMVRDRGPFHRIDILEPIRNADEGGEIKKPLEEFSRILEGYIRKYPEQWLWVHKRWKSTPKRSILILSDGKAGHLNQSLAVARIMARYREEKGYAPENTECRVVEIVYKNPFARVLLALWSATASSRCQGCMKCVRACLTKESYDNVMGVYADVIISCGSAAAPANIFLARENKAKNIVIMTPSLVRMSAFTLAIVPRHDHPARLRNVLVTIGSPNMMSKEVIEREASRFSSELNLGEAVRVGILLGGETPDFHMDADVVMKIVAQVQERAVRNDLEILITTSRRTPAAVEEALKRGLAGFPRCRLLIIASEKNPDGAVAAILGLSRVVIVSGESMSMVSEAVTAGKPTLVFALQRKGRKKTRHDALVEDLAAAGLVRRAGVDDIGAQLDAALGGKVAGTRLNDYENIYNAIGGLV
ncbi:MAG: ELM1/GtrOC1 family putative glycosyltransferase [Candidatus Omnitrophota bacterium]